MTPKAAAEVLRAKGKELVRELREAEHENAVTGLQVAIEYSTGPYKQRLLARLGHPYARRHPEPAIDPGVANVQSGKLAVGWRKREPRMRDDALVTSLYNVAPEAIYFDEDAYPQGTTDMIARPVQARIRERLGPLRFYALQTAVRKGW
jgi:hypothetical protein